MLWWLKGLGLVLIFGACTLMGFMKSRSLILKVRHIYSLIRSVERLAECIRINKGEILTLINECFDEEFVRTEKGEISVRRDILEKSESDLLEEFFGGLGMQDTKAEYERTRFFAEMLKKRHSEAEALCREQSRLYNTLGPLCGLFLVIFLI